MNNKAAAIRYKNLILNKFPESIYAKVLKDPDYLENLEKTQDKASRLYEETYNLYKAKKYEKVIENANAAIKQFSERKKLIKRFEFLKSLSRGKMVDPNAFVDELKTFIETYSGTEQAEHAKAIIAKLKEKYSEIGEKEAKEKAEKIYTQKPDDDQYFVIAVDNEADVNQLVFNLINFNLEYFKKLNLNTNGESLGEKKQLAIVKGFESKEQAMEYFSTYKKHSEEVYKDLDIETKEAFVIGKSNYKTFFKDQSVSAYKQFFELHYFNQTQ